MSAEGLAAAPFEAVAEERAAVLDADTPIEPRTEEVVVLDYGGQYSQLIARRVRECGVFSELLPHHVGAEAVAQRRPKGLILSGGPASVYADGAPRLDPALLDLGIPVLGICYGMQLITRELGGRVEGAEIGEFGRSQLTVREPGRLLADRLRATHPRAGRADRGRRRHHRPDLRLPDPRLQHLCCCAARQADLDAGAAGLGGRRDPQAGTRRRALRSGLAAGEGLRRRIRDAALVSMRTYHHYIDGGEVEPDAAEWLDSVDPYLGEPWARIARGTAADVDRAVRCGTRHARRSVGTMTATERGKLLVRLADLVAQNAERLAEIEIRDNGKLMAEMRGQMQLQSRMVALLRRAWPTRSRARSCRSTSRTWWP